MSHNVDISIEGCHILNEIKGFLEEDAMSSEADEEELAPWINVLSGILVQAAADGWHPR